MRARKDREINTSWIARASTWVGEAGEALLTIKYLYNSPTMNFALLRSHEQLLQVIQVCPIGAELTLWRQARLAIRGTLTSTLIEQVRSSIPEHSECVCVFTASGSDTDPRLAGESWCSVSSMIAELEERVGEPVAIGAWPDEPAFDRICAVKGGVEGPR